MSESDRIEALYTAPIDWLVNGMLLSGTGLKESDMALSHGEVCSEIQRRLDEKDSEIAAFEAKLANAKQDVAVLHEQNERLKFYAAVGYGLEEEMYRHNEVGLMRTKDMKIALVGFKFKGFLGVGEDMQQVMQSANIWPDDAALIAAGLIEEEK